MYPRLPTPPPFDQDQTAHQRGMTILAFVVATDTTATVETDDLELADHVYPLAQAAPDLTQETRTTLTRTRHLILATLATRRRLAAQDTPVAKTPERPEPVGGKTARLEPPPVPRPPAQPAIRLEF